MISAELYKNRWTKKTDKKKKKNGSESSKNEWKKPDLKNSDESWKTSTDVKTINGKKNSQICNHSMLRILS
jgi:hypothetical protein